MPEQNTPDLHAKVSTRPPVQGDRRAARRAQLEQQAAERRRIYEFDEVARARGQRLALRRRMLLWSLPVILVALVVVWKALSVPIIANSAQAKYSASDFTGAQDSYRLLQTWNVAEAWKVHFNEGTAQLANNELDAAIATLFTAQRLAPAPPSDMSNLPEGELPPMCSVQVNLAIAHELKADAAHAEADGHVDRMKREQIALDTLGADAPTDGTGPDPEHFKDLAIATYLEAESLYREANAIRIRNGCPDDPEAADRNVEKETIAREKREALEDPPPPPPQPGEGEQDPPPEEGDGDGEQTDPPPGSEDQPATPELSPEEQRQADLDARNQGGEQERRQTEDMINPPGYGGSTTQNW